MKSNNKSRKKSKQQHFLPLSKPDSDANFQTAKPSTRKKAGDIKVQKITNVPKEYQTMSHSGSDFPDNIKNRSRKISKILKK